MKIAFIHDTKLLKYNNSYFSVSFTYDVWKRYLTIFDDILVITNISHESLTDNKINRYKISSGEHVDFAPYTGNAINLFKIAKHINSCLKKVDAAIVRLPSLLGFVAFFTCRKLNMPCFVELVGCPWDALWNHSIKGKFAAPFFYLTTKYIMKKSAYSLYVTDKFLQRRYPTSGKSIACSNVFINIPDNDSIIEKRESRIDTVSKDIKICTIGGLNVRYKGYDQVVKMISKLKKRKIENIKYYLIGDGNADWIMECAKKYKVEKNIIICGAMPHDNVISFLDEIDIYIQPSLQEGIPRALLEAMSRGCPCIGSNVGEIPEILDIKTIYKRKNINSLVDAFLYLMNENNMKEQAQKNYNRVKELIPKTLNLRRKSFMIEFRNFVLDKKHAVRFHV